MRRPACSARLGGVIAGKVPRKSWSTVKDDKALRWTWALKPQL